MLNLYNALSVHCTNLIENTLRYYQTNKNLTLNVNALIIINFFLHIQVYFLVLITLIQNMKKFTHLMLM